MRTPTRKPDQYLRGKPDPHITIEKFNELESKLSMMKNAQGPLAEEVKRLASDGDFSENAAYQIAKGRLRGLNQGITETEDLLSRAEIIEPPVYSGVVQQGNFVTVQTSNGIRKFHILGSTQTNPTQGIISDSSPLGKALLGKHVGEVANINLISGVVEYKILKIE